VEEKTDKNAISESLKVRLMAIFPILLMILIIGFAIHVFDINKSILTSIAMLLIAATLYFIKKPEKYNLLIKAFSILILFHFLIFPWIYVSILDLDNQSIIIDNDVFKTVDIQAKIDLVDNYEPQKISDQNLILEQVINSPNTLKLSDWISDDQLVSIGNYWIRLEKPQDSENFWYRLVSYKKTDGKLFTDISFRLDILNKDIDNSNLKDLGEILLNKNNHQLQDLNAEQLKIKNKYIWTYARILPYSINIFNSKNIKPVSGFANIIVFLHQLFIGVLVLGLIAALSRDLITKKVRNI
jgi:hypothetical protein